MNSKSFIIKFTELLRYLYNNISYFDYDERQELLQNLMYYRDRLVIAKFEKLDN